MGFCLLSLYPILLNRRIFFEKQVRLQLLQSTRTVFCGFASCFGKGHLPLCGGKSKFPARSRIFWECFFAGRGKSPLLEVILPISGQGDLPFGLGGCSGKRPEWTVNGINWN